VIRGKVDLVGNERDEAVLCGTEGRIRTGSGKRLLNDARGEAEEAIVE